MATVLLALAVLQQFLFNNFYYGKFTVANHLD